MDHTTKNSISYILYKYGIEKNDNNFNEIAEVYFKKDIEIYKVIFRLIDSCLLFEEKNKSCKIEIDSHQNHELLEDISKKFFIKVLKRRRVGSQVNIFFTVLIFHD